MINEFLTKRKNKKEEKARIKFEDETLPYLTDEERTDSENLAKKSKTAQRIGYGLVATTIALALFNGQEVVGGELLSDFASSYSSSVEYFFSNTSDFIFRLASTVIPTVTAMKLFSKASNYDSGRLYYKNKNRRLADELHPKQDKEKHTFAFLKSNKNTEKAKDNLEKSIVQNKDKQLTEKIKATNKQIKRSKLAFYAFGALSIGAAAVLGHQLVDGVFFDNTLSIAQNISNFMSTGSIYDSAFSLKENLQYILYFAVENYTYNVKQSILGLLSVATPMYVALYMKLKADDLKYVKDIMEGKEHKEGIVDKFINKLSRIRPRQQVEEPAEQPIILENDFIKV